VNIYDPSDRMVYVHLSGPATDRTPPAAEPSDGCHRLPAAYANESPRTLLREARTPRAGRAARRLVAGA
jgi:hypothetical protein